MRTTSAPFKRAAYRSQTDEAILLLLEISHADLVEPIRITSDAIDTPHGAAFLATFSRASTATKLDGSQVAAGAPRYETGLYGSAIMVEEGTVNAVTNGDFSSGNFTGWTKTGESSGAIFSVIADGFGAGLNCARINHAAAANYSCGLTSTQLTGVQIGDLVTFSFEYVGATPTNSIIIRPISGNVALSEEANSVLLANGRKRFSYTYTADSTDTIALRIGFTGTTSQICDVSFVQVEKKPRRSSFVAGTRVTEVVSLDRVAAGLTGDAWTIEADVLFLGAGLTAAGALDRNIFCYLGGVGDGLGADVEYHLQRSLANTVGFYTPSGGALVSAVTVADNVWTRLAWSYADGDWNLYVNGVLALHHAGIPIDYPSLNALFLPATSGIPAIRHGNMLIDGLRISNRARTAAELLAGLSSRLRIDADTTAWLGFDGSLNAADRYVSFPFTLTLPDDRDDQINTAKLGIDNVDRSIVQTIRSLTSPPTVTVKIVLASTPDVLEAGPIPFTLTGVSWDALTVEGALGFSDELLGQGYPAHAMTPQLFPGIFA